MDETYVKVAGQWRYVYRAVDQRGQIIDVFLSPRRDTTAARRFFETALGAHGEPVEVVADRAPALRAAIEELLPAAFHNTERYANNRIEADHGRLKARLRPMRGLKRDHSARVIIRGTVALGANRTILQRIAATMRCANRLTRAISVGTNHPFRTPPQTGRRGIGSMQQSPLTDYWDGYLSGRVLAYIGGFAKT